MIKTASERIKKKKNDSIHIVKPKWFYHHLNVNRVSYNELAVFYCIPSTTARQTTIIRGPC